MIYGNIIISGGWESEEITKVFNDMIRPNGHVLICPFSKEGEELKFRMKNPKGWLPEFRSDIKTDFLDESNSVNINMKNYDALFLAGGNTLRLFNMINKFGLDKKFQEFHKDGGIIYGNSAGAILMGKNIKIDPETLSNKNSIGFNWLGDLSVATHWPEYESEYVKNFCAENKIKAICCPAHQGATFDNNGNLINIIGSGVEFIK